MTKLVTKLASNVDVLWLFARHVTQSFWGGLRDVTIQRTSAQAAITKRNQN